MSEKYITKAEILQWVQEIDPLQTTIPNRIMNGGHTWVDRTLVNMRIRTIPKKSDAIGLLREAAACFILSLCCKNRIITQTTGELMTDEFGERKVQFQRTQPMFFFAQGTAESFHRLLSHETFRMMGYEYCRAYKEYYIFFKRGKSYPTGVVVRDKTSRGRFWNEYVSETQTADAEDGDIVPEEESNYNRESEPNWTSWD